MRSLRGALEPLFVCVMFLDFMTFELYDFRILWFFKKLEVFLNFSFVLFLSSFQALFLIELGNCLTIINSHFSQFLHQFLSSIFPFYVPLPKPISNGSPRDNLLSPPVKKGAAQQGERDGAQGEEPLDHKYKRHVGILAEPQLRQQQEGVLWVWDSGVSAGMQEVGKQKDCC